eukprot:TRINITY_DN12478_c0_g1_i1.p1 TRINITY_DN12478_c0_g1~~TRINITY_DN12478_c0_g1_i1.p1  ORF type:complete len:511 (-),score=77.47 TRINITY_DN12478_c0_g1_i1:167-1651(-)
MLHTCLALLLFWTCKALVEKGTAVVPANSTIFLAKFCFSFNPLDSWSYDERGEIEYDESKAESGQFDIEIKSPYLEHGQEVHVLLFDDEAHSYPGPSGQWDSLSCHERIRHAKSSYKLSNGGGHFLVGLREKLRPRLWYVALADCSGSGLKSVEYQVHATNELYGWAAEFSTDRRFALAAFSILCIVLLCLAAAQLRANAVLAALSQNDSAGSKAAHPFARILLAGIMFELSACILEVIHLLIFAGNGHGQPVLHASSLLLSTSANFTLTSLLLLVSTGKCVSFKMVMADAGRMCKLLGPFYLACLFLELWGDFATTRMYTTNFAYTTPCGWVIVLVDLGLLLAYVRNLRATLSLDGGRANSGFYRTWALAYGLWFLALPFSAVLSQAVLAPYVWYPVSLGITKTSTILVYLALVVALWPENTKTHFKLIVASPEEIMEICPSPPSRHEDPKWPAEQSTQVTCINKSQDLPNLLGKTRPPFAGFAVNKLRQENR